MSAHQDLRAAKRALRAQMIARRREHYARIDAAAAALAAAALFPDPDPPPRIVSGFAAMGEEIDPAPLMARLAGRGAKLCLPVVAARGAPLIFRQAVAPQDLVPDLAGILAPPPSSPQRVPDLVIAPLLAFDRRGGRLGYGGGYYDRTVRALRQAGDVRVVGVAFAVQEVEAVPCTDQDEALDAILTETGYMTVLG